MKTPLRVNTSPLERHHYSNLGARIEPTIKVRRWEKALSTQHSQHCLCSFTEWTAGGILVEKM